MADRNDEELVAQIRAGDEEAYEELLRRYGPMLMSVANRLLKNPDDARECFQEALLRAHERIDTFEGRSKLSTWLYRIVVNTCLMRLRASSRQQAESIDHLLPVFDADDCRLEGLIDPPSPHVLLEREETRALVRQAVDSLPDTYRTVLILRDFEELTTAEVASILEIEENNVKVRLHRARSALKKLLEPLWEAGDPEAAASGGSK